MDPSEFKFKTNLEVAGLDVVTELITADLTDRAITDRLITDIFSQLNFLNLVTNVGTDFGNLEKLVSALLAPLIQKGFIELKIRHVNRKPFFLISAPESGADRIFSKGKEQIFINNLLIDAHADVVPYGFFSNGESIIQIDSENNEYIFGRGANDMLTQVAVIIVLLYRLYRANVGPPVVTISTDEELANPGQKKFYKRISVPAAISLEPTGTLRGGVVNEIMQSKTILFKKVKRQGYTSAEIQRFLSSYFKEIPYFARLTINAYFDDGNIYMAFTPGNLSDYKLRDLYGTFAALCRELGIIEEDSLLYSVKPDNADHYYSQVDPEIKSTILDAVESSYGEAELIEDDNSLTTALKGKDKDLYALANSFQCSLGLHLPSKERNTVIVSFPERGGRHTDSEHFKVGEPSELLESLFNIVKNIKLLELVES